MSESIGSLADLASGLNLLDSVSTGCSVFLLPGKRMGTSSTDVACESYTFSLES